MANRFLSGLAALVGAAQQIKNTIDQNKNSTTQSSSTNKGTSGSSGGRYVPYDTSGNNYASMVGMTPAEQAALEAAKNSYNQHKASGNQAGMDAAHMQAEAIRKNYGYSGGEDGSQYIQLFQQQQMPTYQSPYADLIESSLNDLLTRDPFSYDYLSDPLYQQYADMYTREGNRAMQDTLGQVANRTGGMASSYATTAAQQANNYYMSQLSDKIPQLQQLAYSMYMDDYDADVQKLNMLQQLENTSYNQYLDQLNQYNANRDFSYNMYRDNMADTRYDNEWSYQLGRDEISDNRYNDELEYERALRQAETLATFGDFSGYKALGYTDAQISAMQKEYEKANTITYSSSGRSSGGRSSSSSSSKPTLTWPQTRELIEDGIRSQTVLDAYEYYVGQPFEDDSENDTDMEGATSAETLSMLLSKLDPAGYSKIDGTIIKNSDIPRFIQEGIIWPQFDEDGDIILRMMPQVE